MLIRIVSIVALKLHYLTVATSGLGLASPHHFVPTGNQQSGIYILMYLILSLLQCFTKAPASPMLREPLGESNSHLLPNI